MNIRPIPCNAIVLWPDGTWCYHEDLSEYQHMSDDYEIVGIDDPRWDAICGLEQAS